MVEAERAILKRAATGDSEAFRELAERHQGMVFSACRRVLGNMNDAEDASQEVFLQLLRKITSLNAPIAGWLHHVSTQISINLLRQKQARASRDLRTVRERQLEPEVSWEEIKGIVDGAISDLPDDLRVPIVLHYLEGQRLAEIGAELGISESAVSKRLARGVAAMQAQMRKRGWVIALGALAGLLTANAAEAVPASLATDLGKMAFVKPPSISGTHRLWANAPSKVLLFAGVAILLAASGTAVLVVMSMRNPRSAQLSGMQPTATTGDLDSAIAEGIRLLEAGQFAAFVETFVPPDQLKVLLTMGTPDELGKDFGEKASGKLLAVLRAVKEKKAQYDAQKSTATFVLASPIDGRDTFSFVKIGEHWCIPHY